MQGPLAVALHTVFKLKVSYGLSKDCLHQNQLLGCQDLQGKYGYPDGPWVAPRIVVVPVPKTVRDWLAIIVANIPKV